MSSSFVLAGPEAAPTQQSLVSPTNTHQSVSWSSTGPSPALLASITVFLPLFALAVLVVTIRWMRRRRMTLDAADEQPSGKAAVGDVEALAATRPIIPIGPLRDVRWTPQIRSISGPVPGKGSHRMLAAPPPKRARSPRPSKGLKSLKLLVDSCAESAPAHTPTLLHHEALHAVMIPMSPTVAPQALAVSGMEARSLGRSGGVWKSECL